MASDGLKELCCSPFGGSKTVANPTGRDRKRGASLIDLLVDQRGAPLSFVLTGTNNRHDKIAVVELVVSVALKRPANTKNNIYAPTKPTTPRT